MTSGFLSCFPVSFSCVFALCQAPGYMLGVPRQLRPRGRPHEMQFLKEGADGTRTNYNAIHRYLDITTSQDLGQQRKEQLILVAHQHRSFHRGEDTWPGRWRMDEILRHEEMRQQRIAGFGQTPFPCHSRRAHWTYMFRDSRTLGQMLMLTQQTKQILKVGEKLGPKSGYDVDMGKEKRNSIWSFLLFNKSFI